LTISITRSDSVALFGIAYTNLSDSLLEIMRHNETDHLYVTVTSPTVPNARRVYEVKSGEAARIITDDGFIDGLLRQNVEVDEEP
jgi:hypothetical protein